MKENRDTDMQTEFSWGGKKLPKEAILLLLPLLHDHHSTKPVSPWVFLRVSFFLLDTEYNNRHKGDSEVWSKSWTFLRVIGRPF